MIPIFCPDDENYELTFFPWSFIFRVFSNLPFNLLHEYPDYSSVSMESHFKCCLQQVAAKTLGLHIAITYSYNSSWKTTRHKKEEDHSPIPGVPQNPENSSETRPLHTCISRLEATSESGNYCKQKVSGTDEVKF